MNWDRIEKEWTTMTRRIRADWRDAPECMTALPEHRDAMPSLSASPAGAGQSDRSPKQGNLPTLR